MYILKVPNCAKCRLLSCSIKKRKKGKIVEKKKSRKEVVSHDLKSGLNRRKEKLLNDKPELIKQRTLTEMLNN